MPLLDIATAQPSFQNCVFTLRAHNKIVFGNEKRVVFGWRLFQVPKKGKNFDVGSIKTRWTVLVIRAVATLEPQCLVESNGGQESHSNLHMDVDSRSTSGTRYQSSSEDSEELDEKEKLRRMRISIANKGNTPWNKGRKHSAETLQRIRERTRVAMLDPKVKMKLVKMGHAQSKETRKKIGDGVRIGWQRRREKLMLQETCYYEWQNSIAEASRRGFVGEEELQWDSYKIMDEQLGQEWLESVEQRKKMTRPKGSKRAPKSFEQRRKISEAISAKWADPAYRDRVCSALAKYHGTPVGAERKPRRSPSGERQPRKLTPAKKKAKDTDNCARNVTKSQRHYTRLRRNNRLLYKDPLASSKLEMIKNIRAQRAAAETKKVEAIIEQAKLLIAEAEKAAKALEAAAIRSPLARASLIETRKLIAEAIQSIQSIEIGQVDSPENGGHPSIATAEPLNHAEKESNLGIQGLIQTGHGKINGTHAVESSKSDSENFGFDIFNLQGLLNGKDEVLPTSSRDYGLLNGEEELYQTVASIYDLPPSELCSIIKQSSFTELPTQLEPNESHEKVLRSNGADFQSRKEETPRNSITGTRKWVCGSLLEAVEGE